MRFLAKLFTDLASRSTGECVDKETFLRFFPLPVVSIQGIWGERLFDKFDKTHVGKIDFTEFMHGIGLCTRGTAEDKYRFLFSLYDLRGDGVIDKSELVTMLHSTYRYAMSGEMPQEMVVIPVPEDTKNDYREAISPSRMERKSSAALIQRDEFTSAKAEELAGQILENTVPKAASEMDYDQFVLFLEQNPRILDVFSRSFHEELWADRFSDATIGKGLGSDSGDGNLRCCFQWKCCKKISLASVHAMTQPESGSPTKDARTGWLMRRGKEETAASKVFVTLRNSMLLAYVSPASALPSSVIFLEGCYVDMVQDYDEGMGFGFIISHQYETFQDVYFWAVTAAEREEWIARIQQVANSRRIEDFYQIQDKIGNGRFSAVFMAIELETNLSWAVKVIDKTRLRNSEREMLRSEIAIMRILNHPNVVQMKELFEDKSTIYIVMELVAGGELFTRIARKKVFSEFATYHIIKQLLSIVKYLHDVGIVHRDIKPENILLSDDSEVPGIKLADFGLAKLVGPEDRLFVPCGTLAYVAPEVLTQSGYDRKVDMWSVGVITYLMLRGKLPFDSKDKHELIEKTIAAEVELTSEYWGKYTPYAIDFLGKLLTKSVDSRMDVDQALKHSWIRNGKILIPRKLNKRTLEEDLMRKTITSARLQASIYQEDPKSATLDPAETADGRFIYTTPDIFADMYVERKYAERSIPISRKVDK